MHPTHVTKRTKISLCRKSNPFYQCCGSGMFFPDPDPNFPSRNHVWQDPGYGSASKDLSIFNTKNWFYALGKIICDVHPGSRIFSIPDPGSRVQKAPDPGSGSATLLLWLEGFRSERQVWSCAADSEDIYLSKLF